MAAECERYSKDLKDMKGAFESREADYVRKLAQAENKRDSEFEVNILYFEYIINIFISSIQEMNEAFTALVVEQRKALLEVTYHFYEKITGVQYYFRPKAHSHVNASLPIRSLVNIQIKLKSWNRNMQR